MRWIYSEPKDNAEVEVFKDALSIERTLAEVLVKREINTFDRAREYFRPSLDSLHDPFLMADMQAAVDRLVKAIGENEKILIYGDYDVDGTTSVAMFYHFLHSIYANCEYYIPDRYREGYGVSALSIEWAVVNGFQLVITLDCGIKSVDLIASAKQQGIDYIICDHHTPGPVLPPATAVLDPKRSDCEYPYKELSGCGVGFKFIQAFCEIHNGISYQPLELLDLVAVSIASDIVPMTGENRILALYGLKKLRMAPRPGLQALMDVAGINNQDISIMRIVFGLAPRINAAGRLKDAKHAVRLMLAENDMLATEFAKNLNIQNNERKQLDQMVTKEAHAMIAAQKSAKHTTVLFKKDWHKGIIGIVASRCIETYYRPTIIFTQTDEGMLAGSARSVDGFDIYQALESCKDHLVQFGGHKYAAGMTLEESSLPEFREHFEQVVKASILPEQLTPSLYIDAHLNLSHITPRFYRILKQMAPFGPGNEEPIFSTDDVWAENIRAFSSKKNSDASHLKFICRHRDIRWDAIGFNMGHLSNKLKSSSRKFSMAFAVVENIYRGERNLQLQIKDIKF